MCRECAALLGLAWVAFEIPPLTYGVGLQRCNHVGLSETFSRGGEIRKTTSGEIQRAFFVKPDVANQENAEKDQHGEKRESCEMFLEPGLITHRPGN